MIKRIIYNIIIIEESNFFFFEGYKKNNKMGMRNSCSIMFMYVPLINDDCFGVHCCTLSWEISCSKFNG